MLRRYMHKRERHFALMNDNRVVQPFGLGPEFVVDHVNGDDPRTVVAEWAVANSDEHFAAPEGLNFTLDKRLYPSAASLSAAELKKPVKQTEVEVLSWQSALGTTSAENNTAIATYFPQGDKRAAVII
ncbi:MAG: hypothetical protein PSX80_06135, partial [bacterium]|nr:hypothetical protein [bacterium]